MFKNPFSFNGRIRRTEFGLSALIYFAFSLFTNLTTMADEGVGAIILLVVLIPMLWFQWAQGAKRCHDLGKSGWWQIIPFYFFWLLFQEGDLKRNEYGPNPKYPEQSEILESETLDGYLRNPDTKI